MMQEVDLLPYVPWIIAGATAIGLASVFGWIHTTRMRIKHGYPLEGMWGQSLKPTTDGQAAERIRLLTQENAELRAELGSLKDRMVSVEKIVTDSGYHLTSEIDRLRDEKGVN